jgi:hypothetical protein
LGQGFCVYLDGKAVAKSPTLKRLEITLSSAEELELEA